MATQAQSQGRYAVINTLLDTTDVTLIDSLSGRQGDNGRIVYFAIKDGNLPHNLDGQNVVLTAKDSAGKIKQISGVNDMISATGGLFSMLIPGEMYQSAGDIEEAYISIQDNAGTVISSIPVTFTVIANNILFTANASKDYIDSVQKAIDEANSRISGLNDSIKAQQLAYETLKTSVGNLAGQVNSNQVALLNVANHFTDTATFDKGVTANTISTPNFKSDGTSIQQSRDGKTWHNLADDDGVVHKTGTESIAGDKTFTGNLALAGTVSTMNIKTASLALGSMATINFTETATGVMVNLIGNVNLVADGNWHDFSNIPTNITRPAQDAIMNIATSGGVTGVSTNFGFNLKLAFKSSGLISYRLASEKPDDISGTYNPTGLPTDGSTSWLK